MFQATTKDRHQELTAALARNFPLLSPRASEAPVSINGTPEGFFYRFLSQDLLQREERAVDSAQILGALLARPNAKALAAELDPEYRVHRRLVCEDILADVRHVLVSDIAQRNGAPLTPEHQNALNRRLDRYYQGTLRPYLIALHERKNETKGGKPPPLPNGFLSGRQGELNSTALIDHVLCDSAELSLSEQMNSIGAGTLSVEFFAEHHLAGILTSKYQNSPGEALSAYYRDHRSPRVRRSLEQLGQEHFPQQNSLWCEHGSADSSPGEGWEYDSERASWLNKGLARIAIGQVVDHLINNPSGRPLPLADYTKRLEAFIGTTTENEFNSCRVRFNRTFGTVIPTVYAGSLPAAITDYLRHHPRDGIREHFAILQPYHFNRVDSWHDADASPKVELARLAMAEAFATLEKKLGPANFDLKKIPELFENQWLFQDIFFCGFTPAHTAMGVFGSRLVKGVIDFLKHHPNPEIAEFYKELKPRHFARVTNALWSIESFGEAPVPSGWTFHSDKNRFVNLSEAREMMAEFLDRLTAPEHGIAMLLSEIPTKVTLDHFSSVVLPFGARARPMLATVYGDSPRAALNDFITSESFEAFVEDRPALKIQLEAYGGLASYRALAERVLSMPLRGRFSPHT